MRTFWLGLALLCAATSCGSNDRSGDAGPVGGGTPGPSGPAPADPLASEDLPGTIYLIPQGDSSLFSLRPGAVADARRVDAFEWYQQIGYGFDVSRDGAEILYLLKGDISGVLLNRVVIADRATAEFSSGFRLENDYSWNGAPKLSFDKTKIAIYAGYDSGEYRGVSVYDRAGDELFYFRTNLVNPYGLDWMPVWR
jgi:hypothetical protein